MTEIINAKTIETLCYILAAVAFLIALVVVVHHFHWRMSIRDKKTDVKPEHVNCRCWTSYNFDTRIKPDHDRIFNIDPAKPNSDHTVHTVRGTLVCDNCHEKRNVDLEFPSHFEIYCQKCGHILLKR